MLVTPLQTPKLLSVQHVAACCAVLYCAVLGCAVRWRPCQRQLNGMPQMPQSDKVGPIGHT